MEHKTNFNKANSQSYELIFPKLPVTDDVRTADAFTLNIHGTVIPSLNLGTDEMNWQGGMYPFAIAPITFEPFFVNFAVDSDFCNWFMMYQWIELISNNKDHYDKNRKDYWVDATLKFTDNHDNHVMDIEFNNMYPSLLNEVSLSYREGEMNLECGINFNYTRFEASKPNKL